MSDATSPEWTVEFRVLNNRNGEQHQVMIESGDLSTATIGAITAMGGIFGAELRHAAEKFYHASRGFSA